MSEYVKEHYLKIKLLKKTSQKQIWMLKNTLDGQIVVGKLQPLTANDFKQVRGVLHQGKFLQISQGHLGIPTLHWAGKEEQQGISLIIVQHLGETLEEKYKTHGPFSLKTTCLLGIQMIRLLYDYHDKGLVHGNIKLSSFQLGLGKQWNHLFFNDLTYSYSFRKTKKNGKRQLAKHKLQLDQFMSLDRMMGYESSRKDDIESVILLLIFFLKGKLPWTGSVEYLQSCNFLGQQFDTDLKNTSISKQTTQQDGSKFDRLRARRQQKEKLIQKIIISIDETPVNDICKDVPSELKQLLSKIQTVKYDQIPDYISYSRTLRKLLLKNHEEEDGVLDWLSKDSNSLKVEQKKIKSTLDFELPGEQKMLKLCYLPFCEKIQLI